MVTKPLWIAQASLPFGKLSKSGFTSPCISGANLNESSLSSSLGGCVWAAAEVESGRLAPGAKEDEGLKSDWYELSQTRVNRYLGFERSSSRSGTLTCHKQEGVRSACSPWATRRRAREDVQCKVQLHPQPTPHPSPNPHKAFSQHCKLSRWPGRPPWPSRSCQRWRS